MSLITKYGSWRGVCEYAADKLSQVKKGLDKEDFIKWMMLQEHYSPSKYERGLFGDLALYLHCYLIYKKLRNGLRQHHMILIAGQIGKGKSRLGLQIASLVDPTFNICRVCYVPPHLFSNLSKSNPSEAIQVDEGGNFFKSRNSMTQLGRDVSQAFQLVRELQQVIIVCYDEPQKLDKEILEKFDSIFIKLYDPNEEGERKFRSYLGFGSKATHKVKKLLAEGNQITDGKIMQLHSWKGHNSIEVPNINDLNEEVYGSEKNKYLKDHMSNLANKWHDEYSYTEPEDKARVIQEDYIDLAEARKIVPLSNQTLSRMIRNGILKGIKSEYKYFVDRNSLYEYLDHKNSNGGRNGGFLPA